MWSSTSKSSEDIIREDAHLCANRRVLCGHRRCEGLSKKTRESSVTETKWGSYPLSAPVNFSLTFPQVLWISRGKLWVEGVFLFLFQPSDSLCLIFKHPLFFGILFMGAARRAAQHDLQSWLSAPLEILQFPRTDSLTLFASYGFFCRMLYDNDGKKRLFKKRHRQG